QDGAGGGGGAATRARWLARSSVRPSWTGGLQPSLWRAGSWMSAIGTSRAGDRGRRLVRRGRLLQEIELALHPIQGVVVGLDGTAGIDLGLQGRDLGLQVVHVALDPGDGGVHRGAQRRDPV